MSLGYSSIFPRSRFKWPRIHLDEEEKLTNMIKIGRVGGGYKRAQLTPLSLRFAKCSFKGLAIKFNLSSLPVCVEPCERNDCVDGLGGPARSIFTLLGLSGQINSLKDKFSTVAL